MVDDDRTGDLERQLGSEQRDRRPPDIVSRSALPDEMHKAADDDRDRCYRREDARAMLDQPAEAATKHTEISLAARKPRSWRWLSGGHARGSRDGRSGTSVAVATVES